MILKYLLIPFYFYFVSGEFLKSYAGFSSPSDDFNFKMERGQEEVLCRAEGVSVQSDPRTVGNAQPHQDSMGMFKLVRFEA